MKITKMKNQKLKELSHFKGDLGMLVEKIEPSPKDKTEEKFKELETYSLKNLIKIPKEPTLPKNDDKYEAQVTNRDRRKNLRETFSQYDIYLDKNSEVKIVSKSTDKSQDNIEINYTDIKGTFSDEDKKKIATILENIEGENIDLSIFKPILEINRKRLEKIKHSLKNNKAEFRKGGSERKRNYIYEYYSSLDKKEEFSKIIETYFGELYKENDIEELKKAFNEKKMLKNKVYESYHNILKKHLDRVSENKELKESLENNTLEKSKLENLKILTKSQIIYKYLLKDSKNKEYIELSFPHLIEMEMKYIIKNLLSLKESARETRIKHIFNYTNLKTLIENRLKNKLVNYIARKGKVKEYNIEKTTSFKLNEIRKRESQLRGFSSAIASAMFSFRNILDKDYQSDILMLKKDNLKERLDKLDINTIRVFFPTIENLNEKNMKGFIENLKNYIFALRNSILHFKNDVNLVDIINKNYFSLEEINFKEFHKEYVKIYIFEKYNSAGVFDWLNLKNAIKFFKKVKTTIFIDTPKLSPSFNNLYSKFEDYNNLLKLNFNKIENRDKRDVYKFLLSEIYYNVFLDYFLNQKNDSFKTAVDNVITLNENAYFSKKTGFSKLDKFKESIEFESPTQYLTTLHSFYSKNQESLTDDEGKNEIIIFIRKIFTKGFFNFLRDNEYSDILELENNPQKDKFSKEINELKKGSKIDNKILNIIEIKDWEEFGEREKAFYCFLRLIDSKERANLRGFLAKSEVLSNNNDSIRRFNKTLSLVSLINYKEQNFDNNIEIFKKFTMVNGDDIGSLFDFSKNKNKEESEALYCDMKNIKDFKAIYNLKKYGTMKLLENLVESCDYKVNEKEIEKYYRSKDKIEELTQTQQRLHKDYIKNKKFNPKDYKETINEIDEYNKLKNKIEFNDLNLIQSLLLRILYRTAGYVAMWERDLKYILLGFDKNEKEVISIFDYTKNEGGQICPKYNAYLREIKRKNNNDKKKKNEIKYLPANPILEKIGKRTIYIRNYIAHFNYIPLPKYSLKDVFEKMRELLDYDRKLKNSYLKSIKKIFEEYGFEVNFRIDGKKNIELISLESKKTIHLKKSKNKIEIPKHSKEVVEMVKKLFEYKKDI